MTREERAKYMEELKNQYVTPAPPPTNGGK